MKSMKLGGGGRFAKLKASIAAKGNVEDPGAVAAMVGRKKYGAKKMASMAAKGRKRKSKGKKKMGKAMGYPGAKKFASGLKNAASLF